MKKLTRIAAALFVSVPLLLSPVCVRPVPAAGPVPSGVATTASPVISISAPGSFSFSSPLTICISCVDQATGRGLASEGTLEIFEAARVVKNDPAAAEALSNGEGRDIGGGVKVGVENRLRFESNNYGGPGNNRGYTNRTRVNLKTDFSEKVSAGVTVDNGKAHSARLVVDLTGRDEKVESWRLRKIPGRNYDFTGGLLEGRFAGRESDDQASGGDKKPVPAAGMSNALVHSRAVTIPEAGVLTVELELPKAPAGGYIVRYSAPGAPAVSCRVESR